MSIYINGSILKTQPATLMESWPPLQTDQEAIDGTMRRNKFGQKKQVAMTFPIMSPADYTTLYNQFTTGSGVIYYNDASKFGIFTFSGLPSFTDDVYVPGSSLFSPFTVNIREI